MTVFLVSVEILQIAIEIEKNGIAFYHSQASTAKDQIVRDTYRYLAGQEEEHLRTFQAMLDSSERYPPPETYPGEEVAYVKAVADDALFTAKSVARKSVAPLDNESVAIRLAIGMEKDSILLYSQLQSIVRRPDREQVSRVIAEEKTHLIQLLELAKKLDKS